MYTPAQLQALANQHRRTIVEMIHTANAGHPGGSLSVIDLHIGGIDGSEEIDNGK